MRRQRTTASTCLRLWLGCQSRFSVLTQISPALDTFGWKIFVTKYPALSHCGKRQHLKKRGYENKISRNCVRQEKKDEDAPLAPFGGARG